jgi:hypothetical protein
MQLQFYNVKLSCESKETCFCERNSLRMLAVSPLFDKAGAVS